MWTTKTEVWKNQKDKIYQSMSHIGDWVRKKKSKIDSPGVYTWWLHLKSFSPKCETSKDEDGDQENDGSEGTKDDWNQCVVFLALLLHLER